MILGTAAYMSPEQARGQAGRQARRHLGVRLRAVRDADGQRAFAGDDVSETLAAIIHEEPRWDALPARPAGEHRDAAAAMPAEGPAGSGSATSVTRASS